MAGSPTYSLEQICEYFRHSLARVYFWFICQCSIYCRIFIPFPRNYHNLKCILFGWTRTNGRDQQSSIFSYQVIILGSTERSLQACMDNFTHQLASKCTTCDSNLIRHTMFIRHRLQVSPNIRASCLDIMQQLPCSLCY